MEQFLKDAKDASGIASTLSGAIKNKKVSALLGIIVSFKNNFKPSANGCNKPKNPTTLGPLRLCIELKIFLSANVK